MIFGSSPESYTFENSHGPPKNAVAIFGREKHVPGHVRVEVCAWQNWRKHFRSNEPDFFTCGAIIRRQRFTSQIYTEAWNTNRYHEQTCICCICISRWKQCPMGCCYCLWFCWDDGMMWYRGELRPFSSSHHWATPPGREIQRPHHRHHQPPTAAAAIAAHARPATPLKSSRDP